MKLIAIYAVSFDKSYCISISILLAIIETAEARREKHYSNLVVLCINGVID